MEELGTLSEKYETNRPGPAGAGVVSTGAGDAGGVSYGAWQLSSVIGTAAAFVTWLKGEFSDFAASLEGLRPGSADFTEAWKALAERNPEGFYRAQHAFIADRYYRPAAERLGAELDLNVAARSRALREVLWSTAVQHGVNGAVAVFDTALDGANPNALEDRPLILAVYAERGRRAADGHLVHFASSSRDVQEAQVRRYQSESKLALKMLDAGGASAAQVS